MGEMAEGTRLAALAGVASSRGFIEIGAPAGDPPVAALRNGTLGPLAAQSGAPFLARSKELLETSLASLDGAPEPNLGFVAGPLRAERAAVEQSLASLVEFETLAGLSP